MEIPEAWTKKSVWYPLCSLLNSLSPSCYLFVCCSAAKLSPTLRLHGRQHTRLLYPTLYPGICSNSSPMSWWYYLTISSSVTPFSFCLQSFPASGSLPLTLKKVSPRLSEHAEPVPIWFCISPTYSFYPILPQNNNELFKKGRWLPTPLHCCSEGNENIRTEKTCCPISFYLEVS